MVQLPTPTQRRPSAGRRIYDLLRGQMADGTLPPGSPVVSTRTLAAELGVSRTTVTAVYEQLAAEGFLATAPGRAARVAGTLQRAEMTDDAILNLAFDFSRGATEPPAERAAAQA